MSNNAKRATKIFKMVNKAKNSNVLFHELIITQAQLNDETLLSFDSDETDEVYEDYFESIFNNYNDDIRNEIAKKESYSVEELKHFTSVIREATDEFGTELLGEKNLQEQLELYVYFEAKNILTNMRMEFLATELKEKQKKEDTENALATISLLRGELRDLKNSWNVNGFNHLTLVTKTLEKERARVKELLENSNPLFTDDL